MFHDATYITSSGSEVCGEEEKEKEGKTAEPEVLAVDGEVPESAKVDQRTQRTMQS